VPLHTNPAQSAPDVTSVVSVLYATVSQLAVPEHADNKQAGPGSTVHSASVQLYHHYYNQLLCDCQLPFHPM